MTSWRSGVRCQINPSRSPGSAWSHFTLPSRSRFVKVSNDAPGSCRASAHAPQCARCRRLVKVRILFPTYRYEERGEEVVRSVARAR
jgi:hypothetical protein